MTIDSKQLAECLAALAHSDKVMFDGHVSVTKSTVAAMERFDKTVSQIQTFLLFNIVWTAVLTIAYLSQ